ncbi:hypothetical protein ACE6H2_015910 [Prunus campanulata]
MLHAGARRLRARHGMTRFRKILSTESARYAQAAGMLRAGFVHDASRLRARVGMPSFQCKARQRKAWQRKARQRKARHGNVMQGNARLSKATQRKATQRQRNARQRKGNAT